MVKEIQFQRSKQRIFAMDENYNVIGDWECRDDFVPGYNEAGDPRGSLPDGVYTNVSAEVLTAHMAQLMAHSISLPTTHEQEIFTAAAADCLIRSQGVKAGYRLTAVCVCRISTAKN